uniref:DinB-like domain-containing protein n=1 Tax=Schizophyllum commune (strain H4-8 / FGSC 9210) TaxID=578458 RepID=D8PN99_SCHCM
MSTLVNGIQDSEGQLLGSHATTSDLSELLLVCKTVLQQGVDLLDKQLTEDAQLTMNSKFLPGSTIGKHLRHARDHFVLLLNTVGAPANNDFSYDVRVRNTPMETSRKSAREALLATVQQLEAVVPRAKADAIMQLDAITPYMQSFPTSFGRELWFCALHAVHHWSMVRVIAGEMGIQTPSDFGFAPSTLVYQSEASLARSRIA